MPRTLRTLLVTAAIVATTVVLHTTPAQAAVCADHPNQAAAQTAKDTLDGDGDGIYCEAIPCPCSPEWHAQHGSDPNSPKPPASTPSQNSSKTRVYNGRITRVVDGDTLKVKVKKRTRTVRVLGIDTPESKKPNTPVQCGALEASSSAVRWAFKHRADYNRDGLYDAGSHGYVVKLRTDNTQTLTDKYGRLLAYVSRGSSDFGKYQVSAGWAKLFIFASNPFKRVESYNAALDRARESGRGAWSLCPGAF
jgi:micrococcal nuclease